MKKLSAYIQEQFINEEVKKLTKVKIKDLDLKKHHVDGTIYLPNVSDGLTKISVDRIKYDKSTLENWKKEMERRFPGFKNSYMIIDPDAVWFDIFQIDNKDFLKSKNKFIKGKAATLAKWGTTESVDEQYISNNLPEDLDNFLFNVGSMVQDFDSGDVLDWIKNYDKDKSLSAGIEVLYGYMEELNKLSGSKLRKHPKVKELAKYLKA